MPQHVSPRYLKVLLHFSKRKYLFNCRIPKDIKIEYSLNLEKGWGDWNAWSPCAVTCGKGTIGRQRVCLGMQHPELMAAIKSGDKGIPKNFMECHEMNQKETRECDMGRCDSYGWKKNKETGRYEKPHKHEDL